MANDELHPKFVAPSIVWPSIIVIVIGLYGYLTYQPDLESARPRSSNEPRVSPDDSVYARLWQDPLGPEYAEKTQSLYRLSKCGDLPESQKLSDLPRPMLVMPAFLAGGPSVDDRELRRRTRYAILSAVTTLPYRPRSSDRLRFQFLPKTTFDRPLVVPFELFVPDDVDSIYDHEDEPEFQSLCVCWLDETRMEQPAQQVHRLLNELFPTDTGDIEVRVLGPTNTDTLFAMAKENAALSENVEYTQFSEPITVYSPRATVATKLLRNKATDQLKDFLTSPCTVARVIRTIGTDFHLASALRDELSSRSAWPNGDDDCIVLVTERDTLYGRAFPKMLSGLLLSDAKERQERGLQYEVRGLVRKAPDEKLRKEIVRVLESENSLIDEIKKTLPNVQGNKRSSLQCEVERVIERAEKEAMKQAGNQLLVFKYLRGIDGLLPSDKPDQSDADAESVNGEQTASSQRAIQPVGRGQYDYLERLQEQLVEVQNQRRRRGGPGIRAIGVVGTDVYDKLLVLRALRSQFPRTWFFTTDLDENLSRRTEARSTRNLLVASHFALTLCSDLQRDVLPFRDSYQTAYFFSTLMALDGARVDLALGSIGDDIRWRTAAESTNSALIPLVFELGHSGPYQLTATGGNRRFGPGLRLERRDDKESITKRIHPSGPRDRRFFSDGHWRGVLAGMVAFGLAVSLLMFYLTSVRRAIFAVFRAFIRTAQWIRAFVRTAQWICVLAKYAVRQRQRSWICRFDKWCQLCNITQRHFPVTWADGAILGSGGLLLLLVGVIYWDQLESRGEPFELLAGISVWPSVLLRFVVAISSIAFIWIGMQDLAASREQLIDELCIDRKWLTRNTLLPRMGQTQRTRIRAPIRDIFAWTWQRQPTHGNKEQTGTRRSITTTGMLCAWYFHKGRNSYRVIRIATATLIYLGFAFFLFTFTDGFPNHPYRGMRAAVTGWIVLFFAVVFMVALVFFVLDALQLCSRFIRSLSEETTGWPKKAMDNANEARHERALEDLRELLIIRVVARRTNVVGKLLLFPFTVLLLMIAGRHPVFDYWNIPVPLMAVLGFLLGGLILSSLMMRRDATKVRQKVLARLKEHMSVAISKSQHERRDQVEQLIAEIEHERHGAFRPLTDDYVFRALAIPFGGAGGLLLLEQLLT